ncbi:hypothetical protein RB653_001643 [Dictyostelium firmibasis]|uniref:THH1/TOM1/TOM3 domain-containing protein n=1 Tax=Dictyostelium firmibasis TaxID=79012 RepID=A0AAN7U5E2_9MYCE
MFEVISLIYFGDGTGLSKSIQLAFQTIFAIWHSMLFLVCFHLVRNKKSYTNLGYTLFIIILIHSFAKIISNIVFIVCLENATNLVVTIFDFSEMISMITYYCMYDIVLFSWIEVIHLVHNLGHGQHIIKRWRNLFCIFTAVFILVIFIVSACYTKNDMDIAEDVFGYGLISISAFSFCLSIAFLVYWVRLHRMIMSIPNNLHTNRVKFLGKFGILSFIFIVCLDVKIVHYIINIDKPFTSSIWDLYALNYLPEAIAVTSALMFFMGSKNPNNGTKDQTETERNNIKRRKEKESLLSNSIGASFDNQYGSNDNNNSNINNNNNNNSFSSNTDTTQNSMNSSNDRSFSLNI